MSQEKMLSMGKLEIVIDPQNITYLHGRNLKIRKKCMMYKKCKCIMSHFVRGTLKSVWKLKYWIL